MEPATVQIIRYPLRYICASAKLSRMEQRSLCSCLLSFFSLSLSNKNNIQRQVGPHPFFHTLTHDFTPLMHGGSEGEVHITSSYDTISTLDEPILVTLQRDFRGIRDKLLVVVCPFLGSGEELREWDLWGPLLLCLTLAVLLSNGVGNQQGSVVFSAVFVLVWVGAAVVTLNAKLLGSTVAFFQTVCVMGYCLAPLCIGALWCLLSSIFWLNFPIAIAVWAWACWGVARFFRGTVSEERELLVLFPVALFYAFLTWIILVGL